MDGIYDVGALIIRVELGVCYTILVLGNRIKTSIVCPMHKTLCELHLGVVFT